jgi:hypothetical protein
MYRELAVLPFASSILSFVFAFFVFKRYLSRRGPDLLLWGIGMLFQGVGGALYLREFLSAILVFVGFIWAVTPMQVAGALAAAPAS